MIRTGIFRILFCCCFMILVAGGCSRDWEENEKKESGEEGYPLMLEVRGQAGASDLRYELYIFRKADLTADYLLTSVVTLTGNGQDRIKLMNADLRNNSYRFLFTATPEEAPEIAVRGKNEVLPVPVGTPWQEVMLTAERDSLTAENYYGILDREGADLLNTGRIEGILERLVGQTVFDFFKVGSGGINDPVDIASAEVISVLDRVYRLEVSYTGLTRAVKFGSDGVPFAVGTVPGAVTRRMTFLTDEELRVAVPQELLEEAGVAKKGSVRIRGEYGLPAAGKLQIKMVFRYYDTTPICGHPDEIHGKSCFTQDSLLLHLPVSGSNERLSIVPDHYTVNRGGIHFDRIIDLGHQADMEVETDWKNTFK